MGLLDCRGSIHGEVELRVDPPPTPPGLDVVEIHEQALVALHDLPYPRLLLGGRPVYQPLGGLVEEPQPHLEDQNRYEHGQYRVQHAPSRDAGDVEPRRHAEGGDNIREEMCCVPLQSWRGTRRVGR